MKTYNKELENYYAGQVGGLPVFSGAPYQRGHGLGSLFRGLAKMAIPLLKKGAKRLGKEALSTGLAIGSDVMQGKNVKQAAKTRGREATRRVLRGQGIKRKTQRKSISRSSVKRRKTSDIFS